MTRFVGARAESVEPLAGHLYYTDSPLTAAQGEQLTQTIAANTGNWRSTGLTTTQPETDWGKVLTEAENFLAPAQLETLRAIRRKADAQKQLNAFASAFSKSAATGAPPTLAKKPGE